MSFDFPEIAGLKEYRQKADIIDEIRIDLIRGFEGLNSNTQAQRSLFMYLNEKKYDYPWLSWRIKMRGGVMSVVLFFEGLPDTRRAMEDIKVIEGIL